MSSGFNINISGSKVPISYGAIINDSDATNTESTVYIYTSISNLSDAYLPKVDSHDNVDDYFIVMPGYKLTVYTDNGYGGSSYTIDNTIGIEPSFKKSNTGTANTASSVKLYYKNILLTELT